MDGYEAYDATGLAALVAAGEVTAGELLDAALERAARWNPVLTAIVSQDPDLARSRIAAGLPEGPLRGVPFLIKDIGCETPDFPVSLGSRLGQGTRHALTSTVYERLRGAGLVTFGRTACSEGAVGPVTEAAVYGAPTRNPWDLTRTPGGSSGGAGAAVAAGIVPAAHGSDGGGSIRIPASNCGLFGFKPSRGRIPDGPYSGEGWAGMAQDGVLTRTVRDTALLLDILSGPDLGAPYWPPPMAGSHVDALGRPTGRLRVAVSFGSFDGDPIHPECRRAVEETAALLAALGHEVREARPAADHRGMIAAWTRIVACGSASWIRALARNKGFRAEDHIEPVLAGALRLADSLSGTDYLEAVETVHAYGRAMAHFLDGHDVLLSATMAEPPAEVGRFAHTRAEFADFTAYRTGPGGVFDYSPFCAAFNASGQPAMSVPLHWSDAGLPIGVHFAGPMGSDATLIALAAQLEAARPWASKRPPFPG